MPTLDWLNREDAFRIAARVPTRVLRPHAQAPTAVGDAASASGNLLLQGDNLEALAKRRGCCAAASVGGAAAHRDRPASVVPR